MSELTEHILYRVRITGKHLLVPRMKRYYNGQEETRRPFELRIIRYIDEGEYYLFECDEDGTEFTDTWHATVAEAMDQAEYNWDVRKEDWVKEPE